MRSAHVHLYSLCLQNGRNALHLAAYDGHVNTIDYLAPKMDSLLHETDNFGNTMVHHAALKGHTDVVRLVIDKLHLDPTARNKVCVCVLEL